MAEEIKTPPGPAAGTEFEEGSEKDPNPWNLFPDIPPAHQRPATEDLPPHFGPFLDEVEAEMERARTEAKNDRINRE